MKETKLREILIQAVYESLTAKYKQLIKNGEKDKALGLKIIVYATLHPKLREDGSNPWREPNDFLYAMCTNEHVFDMFYKAMNTPNYHLFGRNVQELRTKLI